MQARRTNGVGDGTRLTAAAAPRRPTERASDHPNPLFANRVATRHKAGMRAFWRVRACETRPQGRIVR